MINNFDLTTGLNLVQSPNEIPDLNRESINRHQTLGMLTCTGRVHITRHYDGLERNAENKFNRNLPRSQW